LGRSLHQGVLLEQGVVLPGLLLTVRQGKLRAAGRGGEQGREQQQRFHPSRREAAGRCMFHGCRPWRMRATMWALRVSTRSERRDFVNFLALATPVSVPKVNAQRATTSMT